MRSWHRGQRSARSTTRAAAGLAQALGVPLMTFPSHLAGFVGEMEGTQGKPEEFAVRLREVLG